MNLNNMFEKKKEVAGERGRKRPESKPRTQTRQSQREIQRILNKNKE